MFRGSFLAKNLKVLLFLCFKDNQSQCAVLKNVNPISDTFQQMVSSEL